MLSTTFIRLSKKLDEINQPVTISDDDNYDKACLLFLICQIKWKKKFGHCAIMMRNA